MPGSLNPYLDVSTQPGVLLLRLNPTHRVLHWCISRLLPLFILVMLGINGYYLWEAKAGWISLWLLGALPAPFIKLFVPSWPCITVSKHRIEVVLHRGFSKRTNTYTVQATDSIVVFWKRSYKTASWVFAIQHADGSTENLFDIPNSPFRQRHQEKENLLQALRAYSR